MLVYVACWPLLAYLAGSLIPAIGSGDLLKVSSIIVKSLVVFLVQKISQFGQDIFIAKPSLEMSEVMRSNLFSKIQKIKMNSIKNISAGEDGFVTSTQENPFSSPTKAYSFPLPSSQPQISLHLVL